MFHNCEGQSHKTASTDHNFWRERRAEGDSNRGPSAYHSKRLTARPNRLTALKVWREGRWSCRAGRQEKLHRDISVSHVAFFFPPLKSLFAFGLRIDSGYLSAFVQPFPLALSRNLSHLSLSLIVTISRLRECRKHETTFITELKSVRHIPVVAINLHKILKMWTW